MTPAEGSPTRPILEVRELWVRFLVHRGLFGRNQRFVEALRGVSFELPQGTSLGLVGESGSGKTTLARVLLQLTAPSHGSVHFDAVDIQQAGGRSLRELRRNMQVVFQDPGGSLNPRRPIGWSIAEPLIVHGIAKGKDLGKRVDELLLRVGLTPRHAPRYPHELSGGQRQRVAIARAISLNPKLLICDEALSALDASIQAQILNLLSDLKQDLGLTLLFIAHNLAVVEHFCDRVAVLYLGEIVEMAETEELFRRPRHPYTLALLSAALTPETRTRERSLRLQGEAAQPMDGSGCPFQPRCPSSTIFCRQVAPRLERKTSLNTGHLVACHFAEPHEGTEPR